MVCPYASRIKGAVAYCTILNKKVSTLRYPCKGNYKRCPIYARRPVKIEKEEKVATPSIAEEKPVAIPAQPRQQPTIETVPETSKAVAKEESIPERPQLRIKLYPGGNICDSILLALLVSVAEAIGVFKGKYNELEEKLLSIGTNGAFVFAAGKADEYRIRFAYSRNTIFSIMVEVDGTQKCGNEAIEIITPLDRKDFDLVLYSVSWNDLGSWGNELKKDLENALKQE